MIGRVLRTRREGVEESEMVQYGSAWDAGTGGCTAYRYYDHDASYEPIELSHSGNRLAKRDSDQAQALVEWLWLVGQEAYEKFANRHS